MNVKGSNVANILVHDFDLSNSLTAVSNIFGPILLAILVDLHLRTKADLYSFVQGSFVKIQDLIGYVSKYMLNAT